MGSNWIVLQAEEITLATYVSFALHIAPCFTPAGCQPSLIESFFIQYIKRSQAAMIASATSVIAPWQGALRGLQSDSVVLKKALGDIAVQADQIPKDLETIHRDLCKDPVACASSTVEAFYSKGPLNAVSST